MPILIALVLLGVALWYFHHVGGAGEATRADAHSSLGSSANVPR